jgi:AcrR family transcriptional regulator
MDTYESTGRTNQKLRTRAALVDTATRLVRQGKTPSVAEVAEAALISKSTAYRYFPSQELLLLEVGLSEIVKEELDALYAASERPGPPQERLDAVIAGDFAMQVRHEDAIRRAVSAWIVRDAPGSAAKVRRPGNRLQYVARALEAIQPEVGSERFNRLVQALAMCMGIESLIVLKDICGLTDEQAELVKHWAARVLLEATLDEVRDPSSA